MSNISAKNKIFIAALVWIILGGAMFGYVFNIFDKATNTTAATIEAKSQELNLLEAEQQSYVQAKGDLEKLSREPYQPAELFSKDITLVDEIRTLEELGKQYDVEATLSGLRGTIKEATKVKTAKSELYTASFTLNVVGSFSNIIRFTEHMEHLPFITTVTNINITSADKGEVSATYSGNFYLRKQ